MSNFHLLHLAVYAFDRCSYYKGEWHDERYLCTEDVNLCRALQLTKIYYY